MVLGENDNIGGESKKFSIIIAFHDKEMFIEQSIESVINQDIGFEENVQLILVDDGSSDGSYDIALKYKNEYPDNILLLSQEHSGIPSARNLGFKHAIGEYINFLDVSDYLDCGCLGEIFKGYSRYDVDLICLPVSVFFNDVLRPRRYKKTGRISMSEDPQFNLKFIYSSFFKREVISDIEFDNRLARHEITFASKVLLKTDSYVLLDCESYYNFRKRKLVPDEVKVYREYYLNQIEFALKELIDYSIELKNNVEPFIKINVLKILVTLIKQKELNGILNEEELKRFFNIMKEILNHFEMEDIGEIIPSIHDSAFLIAVKNNGLTFDDIKNDCANNLNIEICDDDVKLISKGLVIDELSERPLYLDFATLRDNMLSFSGFVRSTFDRKNISVSAVKEYEDGNVEIIDATFYDYPTRSSTYLMGMEWAYVYNFDLIVPINDEKEVSSIKLWVHYDSDGKSAKVDCPIRFRKFCNISYASHYYVKDNRIVMFNGKFNVMPYSYPKMFKYEIRGLLKVLIDHDAFFKQAVFFRVANLFLYPFMKNKEIWLIMDRKQAADDNAEHFYKYALKQDDGIKKFFSILPNSPDFERLQNTYGNVLPFESIKHRFYYTFAKKIISSQGSEFYLNPFRNRRYYLTAGISNIDFYFLQHGIIKDNMSSWLRKYDRNPKLIVTSTQLEYESLFDEGYNYGDKVITLLGLPRYDNLNNQGLKKQIVIMPSWRNFLTNEVEVLKSEYFHRFNSLVNNERLIEHARKKGYEIVFKPHPELVRYLYLFDTNDYVQIDENKKYQVIFNESSVLVTDYSSIFFDFSYLKKPLIYYQYGNDYHYDSDNGYFQYETMGFGPVIKDEDELVDKLIEYMDNDCVMEDVYKQRVDSFFKYHDHNNSKRCYDWIISH